MDPGEFFFVTVELSFWFLATNSEIFIQFHPREHRVGPFLTILSYNKWNAYDKVSAIEHNSVRWPSQKCGQNIVKTKNFYHGTKKLLTSSPFYPCITLVVQTDWKLVKKSVEVKKSPQNGTFCLPLFLITQFRAVVTTKPDIGL